ncbi:hypothetical protein IAD21_00496 [Abditibacteriota bacterium]|nr:hypothetical protein IAD21_00496 [Abditibacteriota bacterium]
MQTHPFETRSLRSCARPAFTLIELLVVITIIAILAAILFPVFARARENARKTSCLSNLKNIGIAFMQYTQDYDENYPLTTVTGMASTPLSSWTTSTQAYIKSVQVYRCPSDSSSRWNAAIVPPAAPPFTTSYILNDWFSAGKDGGFGKLSATQEPARSVIMAEKADEPGMMLASADHFHPFYWGASPEQSSMMMASAVWDTTNNTTLELAVKRHLDGANYLYADGHAKWGRFEQLYNYTGTTAADRQGVFRPR